jgi:hypothetical protein
MRFMRDHRLIFAGLIGLLALLTFPIWWNLAASTTSKGPDPVLPAKEKYCVAPRAYMKNYHMELLMSWRDQVVRNNVRTYVAFDGKTYNMSLTGTCMGCHTNKAEFCDRCHNYAGVNPYCWDCHIDPKLVRKGTEYAHR